MVKVLLVIRLEVGRRLTRCSAALQGLDVVGGVVRWGGLRQLASASLFSERGTGDSVKSHASITQK